MSDNTPSVPFADVLSNDNWTPSIPPVPSNANGQSANLYAVSCSAADTCVAVGSYSVSLSVGREPLIETLTDGSWTASQAPLPSDALTSGQAADLERVSCGSDGTCVAIGTYQGANPISSPFIDTYLNGQWTASDPSVPTGDSDVNGLDNISCASATTCIITAGNFYESLNSGQWQGANFPIPTGMQGVNVGTLSCLSSGFCVATGSYGSSNGQTGPIFETLSGGTWTASMAPVPSDALEPDINLGIDLPVCVSVDSCVTIGSYETTADQWAMFSEVYSSGSWTTEAIPAPADALTAVAGSGPLVSGLSCSSGPTCTAVGTYDITASADSFAFTSTFSDGSWTTSEATEPVASDELRASTLSAISCPSALLCYAVGQYVTTGTNAPNINTEFNLSLSP